MAQDSAAAPGLDAPGPEAGDASSVPGLDDPGPEAVAGGARPEGPPAAAPPRPLLAPPGGRPTFVMAIPETGHWSVFGSEAVLGAQLALRNLGGGFDLKTIDETARDFPDRLRSLGSPVVVLGHLFETSLALGAPFYSRAGAPVLLTFIESQETQGLGDGFVRLLPDPAAQGRRLAKEVPRSGKRIKHVYILEGPDPAQRELSEAFREALLNPQAPAPTKANPKPSKPRAMSAKNVSTIPIDSPGDLKVLQEIKSVPQDWILVALPPRLAMRAAPILGSTGFKKATFLMPTSLALREVGASYLAVEIKNLQVALPLEIGSGKNLNKVLAEFRRRFVQFHRREPSWAAVVAYDAATLAALAASSEEGPASYLSDAEIPHVAAAGRLTLSGEGWPVSMVKLDQERLHWLP